MRYIGEYGCRVVVGSEGCRAHSPPLEPLSRCDRHRDGVDLGGGGRPSRSGPRPRPKSKAAYVRLVGYSPAAGLVLTLIIDPHDFSGVTAWKTCGADLRDSSIERTPLMNESDQMGRRTRHDAILAEVAVEEAEAAESEAVEKAAALDVPMHLRIDSELDQQLRQRARDEHIPTSALVRRLLRQALQQRSSAMSTAEVEDIARRVAREELQNH